MGARSGWRGPYENRRDAYSQSISYEWHAYGLLDEKETVLLSTINYLILNSLQNPFRTVSIRADFCRGD